MCDVRPQMGRSQSLAKNVTNTEQHLIRDSCVLCLQLSRCPSLGGRQVGIPIAIRHVCTYIHTRSIMFSIFCYCSGAHLQLPLLSRSGGVVVGVLDEEVADVLVVDLQDGERDSVVYLLGRWFRPRTRVAKCRWSQEGNHHTDFSPQVVGVFICGSRYISSGSFIVLRFKQVLFSMIS